MYRTVMKNYTPKELKRCTGKNGTPILIAFEGKVYDLSKSFLWQDGKHMAMHNAGEDLSEHLNIAPHGREFLARFSIVGLYKNEEYR
jgi:predicted heme/steroid binding protein